MTPQDFQIETGLTARKCQELLGVSSSPWNRWVSGEVEVPEYIKRSMQAHVDMMRMKRILLASAHGDFQWHRLVGGISVYWPELAEGMKSNQQGQHHD